MSIQITNDATKKLAAKYARGSNEVVPMMRTVMSRTAMAATADLKQRMRGGGDSVKTRSGRLRNSMGEETKADGSIIKTLIGSMGVIYARIQEFGGLIKPKRGKYLAIPLAAAKTGAGVPRYASPRDVPDLVFLRSKKGNPILAKKVGKGKRARLVPMFVLVTSVTLKPRLGLRDTVKKFFQGPSSFFVGELQKGMKAVMRD